MISDLRKHFNENFSDTKYREFLNGIASEFNHRPPFRIAETPVFIPKELKNKLIAACGDINDTIFQPNFKEITSGAIKHPMLQVPGEDYQTRFLQMDFGICRDENGELTPQLIEIQGFPSLYFFQDLLSKYYRRYFDIPQSYTVHLNGIYHDKYQAMLKEIIVGDTDPEQVALLEVEPKKQNTFIDFLATQRALGIKVLCITDVKKRGKRLFYKDQNGREVPVKKIYNRVIFDELNQRKDLDREFYFADEVDVEWVGHPNWFFRISKYTMPLLKGPYVPKCFYLDQMDSYPSDLENYVLKPLYSFAGSGVRLDITEKELDAIKDKENFILQRRVNYEPVIQTPNEPAKCEIRMMLLWNKGDTRAQIINNLIRLSKGKMIGVKYNKDKDWVGASVGFFEE